MQPKAADVKTGNSRRILPLVRKIRDALLEYADINNITIPPFNPHFELSTEGTIIRSKADTPMEASNLNREFIDLIKKIGLPRIKIHGMRHTTETILKDFGTPLKDIQLILGHANIAITANIYLHGTEET